jgi:hypothetical protein
MTGPAELLAALARAHAPEAGRAWLERSWPSGEVRAAALRAAIAGCGRRLGSPAAWGAEEVEGLRGLGLLAPERLTPATIGRMALLARALETTPEERHVALVREVYLRGDFAEQAAVLRALPLLPGPERFVDLAIEACRTNVLDVFEAIACESPFPARHFPEAAFNQLVLKAMFMGVALARIDGLDRRRNPELARMARDYASERRAAGRSVPPDIDLAL